jgi:hypothetical protein
MPFPLGVRSLVAGDRTGLAWAWAANGFASVIAAPLAALVGLELGSPALLGAAALAYAAAAGLARADGASFNPAAVFLPRRRRKTVR